MFLIRRVYHQKIDAVSLLPQQACRESKWKHKFNEELKRGERSECQRPAYMCALRHWHISWVRPIQKKFVVNMLVTDAHAFYAPRQNICRHRLLAHTGLYLWIYVLYNADDQFQNAMLLQERKFLTNPNITFDQMTVS
jgi:hypothetical protein